MLTHTQAEINLQVQRQADATTAICEHAKTNCARMDRQSQQIIVGLISIVKKEVKKCINAFQIKAPQSNHDVLRQNGAPANHPEVSQYSIEHRLPSAVDVICESIWRA